MNGSSVHNKHIERLAFHGIRYVFDNHCSKNYSYARKKKEKKTELYRANYDDTFCTIHLASKTRVILL